MLKKIELTTCDPKPFVKWAGGKQSLVGCITNEFPTGFSRYFEPFVGGGSIFFATRPVRAVLGDANIWLLDTYRAIRDSWEDVADILDGMENSKEAYLEYRSQDVSTSPIEVRAAHFIYLNKTCFRGLFRVNKKGKFNVPYGNYDRRYYSPDNLESVSKSLESVEIRGGDFELSLHDITSDDFVYFDPPYYKLGGHSDFNRYTDGKFVERDHFRLASLCRELDGRGVRWAVSNSNTPFVRHLFSGFRFTEIKARREINLNSKNRSVTELLFCNY